MEEWSFYEHSFQFCKCGNDLIRVPINNWSIAVDITSFEDHNVFSVDMYCLWDKICVGLCKDIMNSYKLFTPQESFHTVFLSIFFLGDKYRYFLR